MRIPLFRTILKISPLALACVAAFGQYADDNQNAPQYQQENYNQGYQQDPNDVAGQPVARLSWMAGDVSIRRGDSGQAVAAAVNAPLLVEDYVTTAPGARAELELDYAQRARLGPDAEMRLSALAADHYQLQLSRGFLSFSVLRNPPAQVEISTPSVSVRPVGRGNFRVWVREDGETTITVRSGDVEVFTPRGTQQIHRGQSMLVRGNPQDPEFQVIASAGFDEFDNWSERRDRDMVRSVSYRYVSQDIVGAEDLDSYGRWDNDPQYGQVWVPQVSQDWAPYRDGRWSWEDSYGWTWVGAEPWGWAPYHYGNWYHASFGWAWYPGAYRESHFWRPAVVGFFGFGGGGGFDLGFGLSNVGWCPLAPYEAYHPWYGRDYGGGYGGYGNTSFTNINIVNNTNITNVYRNAVYGATAVNSGQFLNGGNRYVRVPGSQLQNASLVRGQLPFTPTANNLQFSNRQTAAIPRTNFQNSRFYSRNPGMQQNSVRVPFQQQQRMVQQSQQAFARQSTAPGVRFGGQTAGGQQFPRQGTMNGRGAQPFAGQPNMPNNNQPFARGNMTQNQRQPFAGQPSMPNNNQPFARGNMNQNQRQPFNGQPNTPNNNQPFTRQGYSGGAPQRFNGQTNMPNNNQPFARPGYGNLSQRPPQQAAPYGNMPQRQQPQGNWSRFGQPNGAGNTAAPRVANPGTGWSAYSNRSMPMGAPQNQARPQYNNPGFNRAPDTSRQQRSLQLSQPMVQPRSAPAYRPNDMRPSYNAQPSRPMYNAPAPRPSYQAPPSRHQSYSAPAYRSEPSRPQAYSAPAYRPAPSFRSEPSRPQSYSAPAYRPAPQARPSAPPAYSRPQQFSAPAPRPSYQPPPQDHKHR